MPTSLPSQCLPSAAVRQPSTGSRAMGRATATASGMQDVSCVLRDSYVCWGPLQCFSQFSAGAVSRSRARAVVQASRAEVVDWVYSIGCRRAAWAGLIVCFDYIISSYHCSCRYCTSMLTSNEAKEKLQFKSTQNLFCIYKLWSAYARCSWIANC